MKLVAILAALALVAGGATYVLPADAYLLLPDEAKPLAAQVRVEGERPDDDGGGIFYVDVVVRKASVLEEHVSQFRPDGADSVPAHALVPPGSSFEERRRQNLRAMDRSQEIAAAVALRELGYDVEADPDGALVVAVAPDAPARGKLENGDVIVAVDGQTIRTPDELRTAIGRHQIGETVRLTVRADGKTRTETVATIESPDPPRRPIVGINVEQLADVELPIDVEIDLGNVGGPSAGLAFALDVLEELGRDVDRGHRVAATGELQLDGTVTPVGGVKQKTIGARRTDVDVLVVPAGENAAEARRNAEGMRIIAVENFQQALRRLATLPEKR
jgi:PDZ domain-containing protein